MQGAFPVLSPVGFVSGRSHLRAEVHELRRTKILVSVEELGSCQLAFTIGDVAVIVPLRVARIGVLSEVVRRVSDDELRLGNLIDLEVLEMVVVEVDSVFLVYVLIRHMPDIS